MTDLIKSCAPLSEMFLFLEYFNNLTCVSSDISKLYGNTRGRFLEVFLESRKYLLEMFLRRTQLYRSSPPEMFLGKCILKICSKFTGKHPCRSVISKPRTEWFDHTSAWVFSCNIAAYF